LLADLAAQRGELSRHESTALAPTDSDGKLHPPAGGTIPTLRTQDSSR
jgi:hypothetical protein